MRLAELAPRDNRTGRLLRRMRGFTLLEVMMVAAVITILVMVALPSYDSYVRRSKRASAESHLMDVAARQQQYLFDNRAYGADLSTLNMTTPTDVAANYTITVAALAGPPPSFTITATPTGNQVNDLGGVALTITNSGAKTPSGAW
jgi:type IV pilus assembly protein PilE